jgi:hypothetical protein
MELLAGEKRGGNLNYFSKTPQEKFLAKYKTLFKN